MWPTVTSPRPGANSSSLTRRAHSYTQCDGAAAPTANLAIPPRRAEGVIEQTCRHAFLANLAAHPTAWLAVNKMGSRGLQREVYDGCNASGTDFASR